MEKLRVNLKERSYDIFIGRDIISEVRALLNLNRRALVVTDDGVPSQYAATVAKCVRSDVKIITVPTGEGSKSIDTLTLLLKTMSDMKMSRRDCVIAVGGGVVGDLSGFAAAIYMRGIDFYNLPTTLLSMVDSSIGGKTAVNLCGIKNIVGAFHQPSAVVIDVNTLTTLPMRHMSAGACEAVKMAATSNPALFEYFENTDKKEIYENAATVIYEALKIKKSIVEADEREGGIRKILNFGHTLGHGIEAERAGKLFHGECVALGMLPMCSEAVRERLARVLDKLGLPTEYEGDVEAALEYASHDKKATEGGFDLITVDEIGEWKISTHTKNELSALVKAVFM